MALNAQKIAAMVAEREVDVDELRHRMEDDYTKLYRLDPFTPDDPDKSVYTSNDPRTAADKLIALIAGAPLTMTINNVGQQPNVRERNNLKERFLIGGLRSVDEWLETQLLPPLQGQLAFFALIRGFTCGRATWVKLKDGSSRFEVMPWDPLNTYWQVSRNGLVWIAHKTRMSSEEIGELYDFDIGGTGEENGADVIDYYDQNEFGVIIHGEFVVKPEEYAWGTGKVPAWVTAAGFAPPIQALKAEDTIRDFGESVFKPIRDTNDVYNQLTSDFLTLVNYGSKPSYIVKSHGGSKVLAENPLQQASEVSLDTNESIELIDIAKMSTDAGPLLALLSAESQRGLIPYNLFGQQDLAISGFAINLLRQGAGDKADPFIAAVMGAYRQISGHMISQYEDGKFSSVNVRGRHGEVWFDEEIKANDIKGLSPPEIKLVPRLPQDDMQKFAMAQQARQGTVPLFNDRWIHENILGIQDADKMAEAIKTQLAERSDPVAAIWTLRKALVEQGEEDLVEIYNLKLAKVLQESGLIPKPAPPPPEAGPPGMSMPGGPPPGIPMPGGPPPRFDPRVAPNAAMGAPPPGPVPQPGPNVPAGSPRPGARNPLSRLLSRFRPGG